jgi:hypothetical protein
MVGGFITTCAISAYHHLSCEFEPRSWGYAFDTKLCDNVCHWLATSQWFSPGTPISSTNKTDRQELTEILLKVAFNTINQTTRYIIVNTTDTWKKENSSHVHVLKLIQTVQSDTPDIAWSYEHILLFLYPSYNCKWDCNSYFRLTILTIKRWEQLHCRISQDGWCSI